MKRLLLGALLLLQGQPPALQPVRHYDEGLLSKPTYRVKTEIDVKVPMRDGVSLSSDIYRPDVEGKFPAILIRTPYNNNTEAAINQSKFFAERGYVMIQQDVRGKFDSDGQFYPQKNEANDGFDMDEWIGKQPWFNGKLGTMGGSYVGYTQWAQAVRGSKYLVAMAPQVTTPDLYNNWYYTDGALSYAFALSWGAVSIDGHVAQTTALYDWPNVYRHLPIATSPDAAGHRSTHYRDWVAHPVRDGYWEELNHDKEYDKIDVPMLNVEGWYDIFLRGALQDDIAMRKQAKSDTARTGKRIMIGPWVHGTGRRNNTPAGQAADPNATDFGPDAEVDLQRVTLRWFDYWLKGIDNGVATEAPIKIFVMGENKWRYEKEWPLARTQFTKYYISSNGRANSLSGDGVLSLTVPGAASAQTDTFNYDPANPVPTLGGNTCCAQQVPSGPWDQRAAERRDDVLVFSTNELTQPTEVTGPLTMKLYASTSAKDTDWTVKLVDVAPDGFARNVQDGILRARYRDNIGKAGTLLEPGKVYEYTIDMWATSNTFLPGHRIRVEVSSSNFPRFDRNLNTGENAATGTQMVTAKQTIYHSAMYPSHIVLPVIPRPAAPIAQQRGPVANNDGIAKMTNQCASNPALAANLNSTASWNGWAPTASNTRFQTSEAAGLRAEDISKLKLKWAFGLPGGATSSSQPTVALGRVFVGSDNSNVYSMDAKSGCVYWAFRAEASGRFAPIVAPISGHGSSKYGVFFVTSRGTAYALDAQDGKQIWKAQIDGLINISGSSSYSDGRLYIPITGTETMSGASAQYECCRSRGGVAALDTNTGKLIWRTDSIAEPLRQLGVNAAGTKLWGPAGAGVWNTPTVDAKRKRIYVGTGNSYGPIAAETSDSILALNMDDGHIVWSHQEFKGDSFMVGCGPSSPAGGNCPEKLGPDWDFGGSSAMLQRLPDGREILLAAGKGGMAIALDPDQNGKLLWRTKLYSGAPPSPLGLVVFGGTTDGTRAYYPLQRPGGGLTALQLSDGSVSWTAELKTDPRGQIGAASSIPGAIFTGGWDGILRAVDTTGKVIWTFSTNREFESVNGVPAKGGSLGSPGPTIANGMLYVSSGYTGVQNGSPGNVILAFGLE